MNFHMTKDEILAVLKKAGKVDLSIPESKKQEILNNPSLKTYLEQIDAKADHFRGKPIASLPYSAFKLFWETGDRKKFQGDQVTGYFPRRCRLAAFGLSAWLYGREEDIHELEDVIWAVCDEYTWALPAHLKRGEGENAFIDKLEPGDYMVDLFAAETADTLAELVAILGDRLAPIVKKRIACLLEERVFRQVINATYGWMSVKSNWAAVCAGSVGMAALLAIEDDEHLAEVLARSMPAFDNFLQSFSQDGACLEGIGYWTYGFSYYVSFADMLFRRTKGELDMFADPKVAKIAAFQQKCYFKGGRTVSFSDGGSYGRYHPGLASYLRRKYAEVVFPPACAMGGFTMDSCYRWSNNLRDLLWTENVAEIPEEYGCYPLEDAQWYLCSGANDVGIAAKAGHNAEPHNHNDVGSFQIFKNGEEMFADPGSGEYSLQYFSSIRYTFLNCGSQGHSVPMIDGCTQQAGKEFAAKEVTVDETGISMDIAPAYGLDFMPSLKRVLRFDKAAGTTTIVDTVVLNGEHTYAERFVTRGDVTLEPGRAVIHMGEETMFLHYDPTFEAKVETGGYPHGSGEHNTEKTEILHIIELTAKVQGEFTAAVTASPVK